MRFNAIAILFHCYELHTCSFNNFYVEEKKKERKKERKKVRKKERKTDRSIYLSVYLENSSRIPEVVDPI